MARNDRYTPLPSESPDYADLVDRGAILVGNQGVTYEQYLISKAGAQIGSQQRRTRDGAINSIEK